MTRGRTSATRYRLMKTTPVVPHTQHNPARLATLKTPRESFSYRDSGIQLGTQNDLDGAGVI